jgi:hypothetical protein
MAGSIIIALVLIQFHDPAGNRIDVNPREIISVREVPPDNKLLAGGVHCVLGLTNGKFISLGEDCTTVRKALGQ